MKLEIPKPDLAKLVPDLTKPTFVAEPVTETPWVEGPNRWRKPLHSHMKTMWTLFGISTGLLTLWLVGMAAGYMWNGWIHAFAAGAVIMGGVCIWYGFMYCEYLERPVVKRVRNKFRPSR